MCELAINIQKELEENQLQSESDSNDEDCGPSNETKSDVNLFYLAKHLRNIMKETTSTKAESSNDDTSTQANLEVSYAAAADIIPADLYNYLV